MGKIWRKLLCRIGLHSTPYVLLHKRHDVTTTVWYGCERCHKIFIVIEGPLWETDE